MSAVAEHAVDEATGTAREVAVQVPPDEQQVPFVRHVGELLLRTVPGLTGDRPGHPRTDDVLVVASEFTTNAVIHGNREPDARIFARYAVSGDGSVLVFVRNDVGAKPTGFVRLPEGRSAPSDHSALNPESPDDLEQFHESGMGLRCVVPGHADTWQVEVRGPMVVAWAVFGLVGETP